MQRFDSDSGTMSGPDWRAAISYIAAAGTLLLLLGGAFVVAGGDGFAAPASRATGASGVVEAACAAGTACPAMGRQGAAPQPIHARSCSEIHAQLGIGGLDDVAMPLPIMPHPTETAAARTPDRDRSF